MDWMGGGGGVKMFLGTWEGIAVEVNGLEVTMAFGSTISCDIQFMEWKSLKGVGDYLLTRVTAHDQV